ncbi:hypothetical protein ACK3TF_005387 [Chlorella vulgaris]
MALTRHWGVPIGGCWHSAIGGSPVRLPVTHQPRSAKYTAARCSSSEPDSDDSAEPQYSGSAFVRQPLISPYKRTAACRRCDGCGSVQCTQCGGTGRLARGGYQKRNPINVARVIGSKWTAMERTFGWRHFRVMQKKGQGKGTFVLMTATCDESTQFWVNMQNLKDRDRWASGWLQKQETLALEQQRKQAAATGPAAAAAVAGGAVSGTACKACGASGTLPCPLCSLAGQVVEL